MAVRKRGLVERIEAGENIVCAEGYLLAMSRRGYIAHGLWVPDFILEHSEALKNLHYEMAHCGTDVIEAFQYNTARERMREIGREDDLEKINRKALTIAREVAREKNLLFAGGTCRTNTYVKGKTEDEVRAMYDEQVLWSKEEGVDYMIAETMRYLGEAKIALEVIKSHGLPAVVTMTVYDKAATDGVFKTLDDVPIGAALKELLDLGATLVGVNCTRGPQTMLEVIEEVVKVCPPERVCALPVAYRTTEDEPTFFSFKDKGCPANNPVFPRGLEAFCCTPVEIKEFTERCLKLGLKYLGICCGNSGELTRTMAEAMGKTTPASKYCKPNNFGTTPALLEKLVNKGKTTQQ